MRDPACAGSYGAASLPSQGYGPTSRGCGIACGREALSPRLQVGNGSLTRLNSLKLASCRLLKFFFGERRFTSGSCPGWRRPSGAPPGCSENRVGQWPFASARLCSGDWGARHAKLPQERPRLRKRIGLE